jgi:hypothetical protein
MTQIAGESYASYVLGMRCKAEKLQPPPTKDSAHVCYKIMARFNLHGYLCFLLGTHSRRDLYELIFAIRRWCHVLRKLNFLNCTAFVSTVAAPSPLNCSSSIVPKLF